MIRGAALAVVGGLLIVGGATAPWVRAVALRDVGGLEVVGEASLAGTALVGWLVGVGVASVLAGLILLLIRRTAAVALGLLGAAGLCGVAVGLVRAAAQPGTLAVGPGVAGLGAITVLAAAYLALRRPAARPALPARYDLDEDDEAAVQWRRASVERDGPD